MAGASEEAEVVVVASSAEGPVIFRSLRMKELFQFGVELGEAFAEGGVRDVKGDLGFQGVADGFLLTGGFDGLGDDPAQGEEVFDA